MKIKAILDVINSVQDRAGNCYWAFRWTDTKKGKQVVGKISGGESNLLAAMRYVVDDPQSVYWTRHEYSWTRFNTLTGDWPYAGSNPEEGIAAFIKKGLARSLNSQEKQE